MRENCPESAKNGFLGNKKSAFRNWYKLFNLSNNKHYSLDPLSIMLKWTIIFLVVAIIAGVLGFGGVAAGAAGIAKILFFVFIVLFVVSLIFGRSRL